MILNAYDQDTLNYFKENDPIMYQAMIDIGPLSREGIDDPFQAIVSQIISQQISTKAAVTVKERLNKLLNNEITPKTITALDREELKSIGISYRKSDYLLNIADKAYTKEIDFDNLKNLTSQEVTDILIKEPGIGIWTVEMLLLFSLKKDDVISYNDLMIREGMKKLYGYETLSKKEFNKHKAIYQNYASKASIYLWHISKM